MVLQIRAVFTWLSKGIGFGFGFGFTTPFGWLVYLLWFWFYDSQVKTALISYFLLESMFEEFSQSFWCTVPNFRAYNGERILMVIFTFGTPMTTRFVI